MEKKDWVYDIEVFPNFFCVTFLDTQSQESIRSFVISWGLGIDDGDRLRLFLDNECNLLIGYNNFFYDYPILNFVYEYSSDKFNEDVFNLSKKIISSERLGRFEKFKWPQMDLMKMMAFDKLGVSLKQCAINLKWHKIQDLPLPYDHSVQKNEVEIILRYNINDVRISFALYESLQPQIILRKELSKIYDVELTSASDSKIANVLLEKFYTEKTGVPISELKNMRTKRDFLWLKECISKKIKFKTVKLSTLKNEIENTLVVSDNGFAYKKEIEFGNCVYELGIGGLHSDDNACIFETNDDYQIRDCDVASYYPNIIITNGIKPAHLGDDFIEILKTITMERIEAKKSGNKTKADGLKITINSIFGKLGSDIFWLYDPKAMLSVTVSGQLFLLMLIEDLVLNGINVISANTDGIVSEIPKEKLSEYDEICKKWQEYTGFELEFTNYSRYIRQDVNNYITKKEDGKTKEKGRFMTSLDLKKGYHYPVVPKSMYKYFVDGTPVSETIRNCTDILDFCLSQKAGKDFAMMLIDPENTSEPEYLQKTNRYFVATTGKTLVKKNKNTESISNLFVGKVVKVINDYQKYLNFDDYNVDYSYYEEEANKYINEIESGKFPHSVNPEEIQDSETYGEDIDLDTIDRKSIVVKPPQFGFSKFAYYFDKKENVIYKGIGGIKFITSSVAKELCKLYTMQFDTFTDLLIEIENSCAINSKQLEILIMLDFFKQFGKNKKLLDVYTEFSKGKNKYKKSLKEDTRNKRKIALVEYETFAQNSRVSFADQIAFEKKLLGDIRINYNIPKNYIYILSVNLDNAPKIRAYCFNNGVYSNFKIKKPIFYSSPFIVGDVIYCPPSSFSLEKKSMKGKDGEWIKLDGEKEFWLNDYKIISQKAFDKIINQTS